MHVKKKCARIKEEKLDKNISELPSEQQAAVRACFQASKVKSSTVTVAAKNLTSNSDLNHT